tara:strand:- start:26066 stop:26920 length:855 start_codon:yes stop_codon:yes gene_type:complete
MENNERNSGIKFTDTATQREKVEDFNYTDTSTQTILNENPTPKKDTWEIKDRIYYLVSERKPLTYMIKSKGIMYFDEERGYERELRHTTNQRSPFVDEFKGDARLEQIVFRNGVLSVPRNKQTLQKLLSLYHPQKDTVYYEWQPKAVAASQLDIIETEINALNIAKDLDIDTTEAIMRVEVGSEVSNMSSKELKRDLLLFAKRNPELFLDLATDENVQLRNMGIKATEAGIIELAQDQRTFKWCGTDRKLMTVPFGEHPYSALAMFFKTDEGLEIYNNIEKRLQ